MSRVSSSGLFRRRALLLGAFLFAISLFLGIAWRFWREFGNDLFHMPRRVAYDLTLQASLGPIYVGSVLLLPLTLAFVRGNRNPTLYWLQKESIMDGGDGIHINGRILDMDGSPDRGWRL